MNKHFVTGVVPILSPQYWECGICGNTFKQKAELKEHKNEVHSY